MLNERCPRCNRKMESIAIWRPVKIGDDDSVHVCIDCAKEADLIDKNFAEACTLAKRVWLGEGRFAKTNVLPTDPLTVVKAPTKH